MNRHVDEQRSDQRCPKCAKALTVEPADGATNTTQHHCLHCGYRETVRAPRSERITRGEVRRLIRTSRRLLLGPSCYGRRHRHCTATNCECPCHTNSQKGQS
ncbi:hypothetical protein ACIBEF_00625 [Micromonospora sp. NPDC050795]|uniref:hypothetical protein n=1 Tax=Micromonospora sp. NPDC050795 TaxID=3364282 RepID=UPI00379C20A7